MSDEISTAVFAVLLVPAKGDPFGLLKEGACGQRPPMAQEYTDGKRTWWQGGAHDRQAEHWRGRETGRSATRTGRRAVALAWEAEPIAEGCDRALRAAGLSPWRTYDDLVEPLQIARHVNEGVPRWRELGAALILDSDWAEMTP